MFDSNVYDQIAQGCQRSARTVVPRIMKLLEPHTVLDVGCGEGWWLSVFAEHGCDVTGVDGGGGTLRIDPSQFHYCDLANADHIPVGRFDLTMSLEVAEHLPPHRADWFVGELCSHSDIVFFSAAIPAQGGNGHLNEQWASYWVERFAQHGWAVSGALRWFFWDMVPGDIEVWYAQNMLLAVDTVALASRWEHLRWMFDSPMTRPFDVVHPFYWDARHGR
jgi:SAM-dependent methyltransferase